MSADTPASRIGLPVSLSAVRKTSLPLRR